MLDVGTEFPASVSADSVFTVSRAMKLGTEHESVLDFGVVFRRSCSSKCLLDQNLVIQDQNIIKKRFLQSFNVEVVLFKQAPRREDYRILCCG